MMKLILLVVLFLLSLLVIFRSPANLLWYVSILVTEFSVVFILLVLWLVFWPFGQQRFQTASTIIGLAAVFLYALPYWQAWRLSPRLKNDFAAAFPQQQSNRVAQPFSFSKIFTGLRAEKIPYQVLTYDSTRKLTLHFYSSGTKDQRPCIIVVHGGSWAAGDNQQLPELNSILAKAGYQVASINYRLAPANRYPAPVEDVQSALQFLQERADSLSIDRNRFVLLGRSAGGQVALSAAYTLHAPAIRAVIDFYGPTDMVWGYENPTNPLVLNSRKVMEDYLGGSLASVPEQYVHSSATETVTTRTPPTLMIYAENDPLVSPRHGNRLGRKLTAMNIPHFALYLPWATHAFDFTLNGPGGQLSTWTVLQFLKAVFNESPPAGKPI